VPATEESASAWLYDLVPWGYKGLTVSLERCERIAREYADFKRAAGKIDFEDMLEAGRTLALPVRVFLVDEVQDNSPLLWQTVDAWIGTHKAYLAGDPYQAIYLFSGAEPSLFIEHPGALHPLGDSRRLTARASEDAQQVLRSAA
jgi:ATP-dependent exoDNAse (exonuclease V) beta subunit